MSQWHILPTCVSDNGKQGIGQKYNVRKEIYIINNVQGDGKHNTCSDRVGVFFPT